MNGTILVSGGTGLMGRRVASLVRRFAPAASVVLGTHRRPAPPGWPSRPTPREDHAALARALEGIDVLVEAAGPYRRDPRPVLRACIAAGVHYIDLAEHEPWITAVRAEARGCPTAVVPGASTIPGLIDLLMRAHAVSGDVLRATAFLRMATNVAPSVGMLCELLGAMGERSAPGEHGCDRLLRHNGHDYLPYPAPPVGPGDKVPLTLRVGFDRPDLARRLHRAAPFVRRMPWWARRILARALVHPARVFAREGTADGQMEVHLKHAHGDDVTCITVHATGEPLDIPALPAALAACELLLGPDRPHGYAPVASVVTPTRVALALRQLGGRITIRERAPRGASCAQAPALRTSPSARRSTVRGTSSPNSDTTCSRSSASGSGVNG